MTAGREPIAVMVVREDTLLAEAVRRVPELATLLAYRGVPTASYCAGPLPGTIGENAARAGVADVPGLVEFLNEFLRSGEHPARFLRRWRAARRAAGEAVPARPTFAFLCECHGAGAEGVHGE